MRRTLSDVCARTFGGVNQLLRNRVFSALLLLSATVLIMSHFAMARNLLIVHFDGQVVMLETYETDVQTAFARSGIQISGLSPAHLPQTRFSGGVSSVTIDRSYTVTVKVGNNVATARANGETVGAVLTRLGIEYGIDDLVEPTSGVTTRPGMTISVVRVGTMTKEFSETLPFETRRVATNSLYRGRENVRQEGSEGEKRITYTVNLRDGIEISRERSGEEVVAEPQERIVEYGTRVPSLPAPSAAAQPFITVVSGGVVNTRQGWGPRFESRHRQGSGIICETGGTLVLSDGSVVEYVKAFDMMVTAYTSDGEPSNRVTAIGTQGRLGVAAVDRRVIPLRTNLLVIGANGRWSYGFARAENVGGAVRGYIIDVYFPTRAQVNAFGRRWATVYVLR
ncbi:MAG: G5 domain-containing protein [Oscillospiraceae bacterium]|nr:G5 domain-containing protein [Oscillospiraceae bacterium]